MASLVSSSASLNLGAANSADSRSSPAQSAIRGRQSPLSPSSIRGVQLRHAATARPQGLSTHSRQVLTTRSAFKGTVIPDSDPRIPIVLLGTAGLLLAADNKLAAAPVGLLGALLLFQTTRVKFVFGEDALEVRIGQTLDESGENVFVGGENKWKYDTFVNWEFWWPLFPVLVYFKETQTKPEGQIHFFPIILNGKQLYDVMKERCGTSKTSA